MQKTRAFLLAGSFGGDLRSNAQARESPSEDFLFDGQQDVMLRHDGNDGSMP